MNRAFWNDLPRLVRQIDDDGKARAIVVSSTGRHFSAGMDLAVFTGGEDGLSFKAPEVISPSFEWADTPFLGVSADGKLLSLIGSSNSDSGGNSVSPMMLVGAYMVLSMPYMYRAIDTGLLERVLDHLDTAVPDDLLPATGIGLPGRFVVEVGLGKQARIVDPFSRGRALSVADALEERRQPADAAHEHGELGVVGPPPGRGRERGGRDAGGRFALCERG